MDKNINEQTLTPEPTDGKQKTTNTNSNDNDGNNLLSNDKVDVGIKPDVKSNDVKLQMCSLSFNIIFNCCSKQKDSDE